MDIKAFDDLFNEKKIAEARSQAENKYRDLTSDQVDYFKKRMKNDLFFLASSLGYSLLSPRLHGNFAAWLMKNRGYQYLMELLPRMHYKSTLDTIVDSIQMALPDVCGGSPYPYNLGPNIKLLLMHEVRDKAADFLFEISQALTRNEMILAFFPEIIPKRNEHRMNRWELELPRTEFHREATFETLGCGSAQQGGHYHWLKLDDLFGEEARDSESVRAKVLRQFDNISSLLTRPRFDGWRLVGTRYSFGDLYSHAMNRYGIDVEHSVLNCIPQKEKEKYEGGQLRVYARGIQENGEPIFPEEVTKERIIQLRKNPVDFAAQHANNPMESGIQEFSWPLKFYNVDLNGNIVVFTGESSFKRSMGDLDIVVLCDPSMGENEHADDTGMIITGVDNRSNIFILETIKKRLIPPVLIDELIRLHFKYRPRLVGIEEVNFSAIYKYWIEERMAREDMFMPIRPYKPGNQKSKNARIRGLSHFFSAGQIYCHEGMHDFRDEYEQFPLSDSQHLLDALAQGPNGYWQKSLSSGEVKKREIAEQSFHDERDVVTGY